MRDELGSQSLWQPIIELILKGQVVVSEVVQRILFEV